MHIVSIRAQKRRPPSTANGDLALTLFQLGNSYNAQIKGYKAAGVGSKYDPFIALAFICLLL